MKRMYYILFACMLFGYSCSAFAQTNSLTDSRRQALLKVITTLEDYEYYSTMDDADMRNGFMGLFVNSDVSVYNDLLGLSDKDNMTVGEYVKLMSTQTKLPSIRIKNIKKESISYDNDVWRVVCSFEKEMSYTDICGVLLSSNEFYHIDYDLRAYLIYSVDDGSCKIEKIEGGIESDKKLSTNYSAIQRSLDDVAYDNLLLYNNHHLSYNAYGQSLIDGQFEKSKLVLNDPDVVAIPVVDPQCNKLITLKYTVKRMRLKLHYDFGMGETFGFSDKNNVSIKTSENNIGMDFGYIFPSKGMIKIGAFGGLGLSSSTMELSCSKNQYDVITDQDVSGEEYKRQYHNLKLSQKFTMSDLSIPIYMDFDLRFGRVFSLYADLGVNLHLNLSRKVDSFIGEAYIDGIFVRHDNLLMNEHWGFDGFGNHTFTFNELDNQELLDVNSFTADLLAGAGFRISIPSTSFTIDLGIKHQMGLMDVIKGNPNANQQFLVYNTVSGLASSEHARNLTEFVGSMKRKAMKFNVGITYKF